MANKRRIINGEYKAERYSVLSLGGREITDDLSDNLTSPVLIKRFWQSIRGFPIIGWFIFSQGSGRVF